MTGQPNIRVAVAHDLPALARLAETTFRQAFASENDPADFEAYVGDAFSERRLAGEMEDRNNTFFVAVDEDSGALCGYAKLRRGTTEPSCRGARPIELERIYADSDHLGRGLGARLMQRCLDVARDEDRDSIWLGVWERNERAIRFYRRLGFEVVGEHPFQLGSDLQTDLVMERRFGP